MKHSIAAMVASVAFLVGCTTTGFHTNVNPEIFGEYQQVRLCLYLDRGVSEGDARLLIQKVWQDEAMRYRLEFVVAEVNSWPRPAFAHQGIMDVLVKIPLRAPCDRIFALVGRNFFDFLWGMVGLPEILGEVNDATATHGFAVATSASLNQIFISPTSGVRHEFEHLLGCKHDITMDACYRQIAQLKEVKRFYKLDFFPARSLDTNRIFTTREQVNTALGIR